MKKLLPAVFHLILAQLLCIPLAAQVFQPALPPDSVPLTGNLPDSLHFARVLSLAPFIGDEIDETEKSRYGLFPEWSDAAFRNAKILLTTDSSIYVVAFLWDGTHTLKKISEYGFENMQWHVEDIYYALHPYPDTLSKYKTTVCYIVTMHYHQDDAEYGYDSPFISFSADSLGHEVQVQAPYWTDFLGFHCHEGDRFAVSYRKDHPHDYELYTSEPLLDDSDPVDTAVATITNLVLPGLLLDDETVEFRYTPKNTHTTFTRMQDFQGYYKKGIAMERPDLIEGRKFYAVYSKRDPGKCVLLPYHPADSGTYFYHPQKNFIGTGLTPLFKVRAEYGRVLGRYFAIGASTSYWYGNNSLLGSITQGLVDTAAKDYDADYYYKFSRFVTTSPFIEWYPMGTSPYTFCFRFWGTYAEADGMKVNYANNQNATQYGTGIFDFLDRDSSNLGYFPSVSFNTWGWGAAMYFKTFLDNKYHWQFYWSLGYRYLHLPASVTGPKDVDGTRYYFFDFPVWSDALHVPLHAEWGLQYKF